MRIINLIMIPLSTIFLTNCPKQAIICAQIESAKIKPLMLFDTSFKYDRCRGRCFDFNSWNTLPIKSCIGKSEFLTDKILDEKGNEIEVINYPIEFCEGVAGFSYIDMASEIRPKIKKLDGIKKDYCN